MRYILNFDETTVLHHQGIYNYFFSEQNLFHRIGSWSQNMWQIGFISRCCLLFVETSICFSPFTVATTRRTAASPRTTLTSARTLVPTLRDIWKHTTSAFKRPLLDPQVRYYSITSAKSWKVLLFITKLWDHSWINFTPWR